MGHNVLRVKNEQIKKMANVIAERIIQRYFEIVDSDAQDQLRLINKTEELGWSNCIQESNG